MAKFLQHCVRRIGLLNPPCIGIKTSPVTYHWFSTTSTQRNLLLDVNDKTGVATLQLNKKPVNSLSLEMLTELNITLEKLENEKCRGVILTSALPGIFSAGLDILEMYGQQPDRLSQFWGSLQDFWIRLYGSKMITIAAINGHSPAGGCLMAVSTDYRVMAEGKYSIGLNETLLGIVAPPWFQESMERVVGQREMERALQLGHLYSSSEAFKVGLVDQIVPIDQVVSAANQQMTQWLKIPDFARQITKQQIRKPTLNRLITRKQEDIDNFVNLITKPSIQKSLEMYLESLKKKQTSDKAK